VQSEEAIETVLDDYLDLTTTANRRNQAEAQ